MEPFLLPIKEYQDQRGLLGVTQEPDYPFVVRRVFWLTQVPENTERGGHAHIKSQQFLICIQGVINVNLENLQGQQYEFCLKESSHGLFLPPLYWGSFRFSSNAMAITLASDPFDEDDYIRNFGEFQKMQHDH